ncbi:MAG: type III-E CRISPR-associated protein Csx30 [Thermodesulfobacteriota bacterium]
MSIEHEYGKTENILYSQSLDLLLEWGRIHLFHQKDTPMLQELEGKWEYLKAVGTPLDAGLDLLENRVRTSLKILHGPATIHLERQTAGNIMAAIKTLDQVVFLSEALESFPTILDLPPGFREKSDDLLHRVTIERTPPTLRLIPLNEWRREVLKNIPSQVNYLFPWYGLWVELPTDFLDTLTERFEEAAEGEYHLLPLDPNMAPVLLGELKSDPPLLERVRRGGKMALPPPKKDTGFSQRLIQLYHSEIAGRTVPDDLQEVGLLVAACQAVDTPTDSGLERMEQLFLAAFCTPFPDDASRRNWLDEIEAGLNRLDPSSLHASNLLEPLCFWSKGRLGDEDLVQKVWPEWEHRLLKAADQIEPRGVFLGAVENLRGAGKPKAPGSRGRSRWNRLFETIKSNFSLKRTAAILIIGTLLGVALLYLLKPEPPPPAESPEPENRVIKGKIPAQNRPSQPAEPAPVPKNTPAETPAVSGVQNGVDPFDPLLAGPFPEKAGIDGNAGPPHPPIQSFRNP